MATADHAVLSPLGPNDPQEIAGYRLLARIGEGGMGSVYLSRTRGNQPVALKVIRREFAQEQDFRARFEHEVQAARRVQGYHIVPVVDHDTSGEQPWLASAYVPGLALDDALATHGPLPMPAVFQLIGCTAQALHSVHAASVIHRDLKPSNILLSSNGPWVIDFGIARATDATQLTRSGGFIGTPQYMSPEHALGRQVTPATDIFALGLIAAVVATGRHPYGDGAGISIAASIANTPQQAPDLSGYPDPLRPLLERCLAADASQRPGPAELAEWCQRAAGRPLRDFKDWLPAGLTAEIARREQLSQTPPQPQTPPQMPPQTPPQPSYNPTYVPTQASGPGQPMQGTTGPQAAIYGAATATASVPTPAPTPVPVPVPPNRGRSRVPLVVGAGILAVVLAAGGTWYVTRADDKSGNGSKGGDKAADQPKPSSSEPQTQAPASAQPQTPAAPGYTVVFNDKSLKLLAPREFGKYNDVDLDFPKVAPFGEIASGNRELQMGFDAVESRTTFGKSKGPTPEQCATGAATNPIPDKLNSAALTGADSTIVQGDLLCTVTSKGNLAMVKIVGIEPSTSKQYDIPTYLTEVTLWKRQS
ncbi:serine/threonine-protein kinase [Streptomyces sp. NBC_00162]|uniref:serine/threonine-protein kinase n=1 Tax=Streptomyces sp. NBC_00162 TaxID=2903629 RepID=UPI00214AAAD8|nr:serine/threonine-protein kinase [Streptomyces sp. NBC_00162]UUU41190.1 serine/threonine protein kinase [Streptomyces sp. NBC_00162]